MALILNDLWKTMDLSTGVEVARGKKSQVFKDPYIDENDVVHWFAYAADELLSEHTQAVIDEQVTEYFKEWCDERDYKVGEGRILKTKMDFYNAIEYEYLAPIIREDKCVSFKQPTSHQQHIVKLTS